MCMASSNNANGEVFGVVQAELETGILLKPDGQRSLDGRVHAIPAKSLEDARRIAMAIVAEKPYVECSIRNGQGSHVEFVRVDVAPSSTRKTCGDSGL
jgi:hypothetical protein